MNSVVVCSLAATVDRRVFCHRRMADGVVGHMMCVHRAAMSHSHTWRGGLLLPGGGHAMVTIRRCRPMSPGYRGARVTRVTAFDLADVVDEGAFCDHVEVA